MICNICLDQVVNEFFSLSCECDYLYHNKCIEEWLRTEKKCPKCEKEWKTILQNKKKISPVHIYEPLSVPLETRPNHPALPTVMPNNIPLEVRPNNISLTTLTHEINNLPKQSQINIYVQSYNIAKIMNGLVGLHLSN